MALRIPTPVIDVRVAAAPAAGTPLAVVVALGDTPDGGGPGARPDGGQPDGGQPDGDQPGGGQPDGGQPGGGQPGGAAGSGSPAGPSGRGSAGDAGDGDTPDAPPVAGPHAARLGVDDAWLDAAGVTGAAGSAHAVVRAGVRPGAKPVVGWVVGVGSGSRRDYRRAGAALVKAVDARAVAEADRGRRPGRAVQVALPDDVTAEQAAALATGMALGGYRFTVAEQRPRVRTVTLVTAADVGAAVTRALVLAAATLLTRDLANTPSDVKGPSWLADTTARLAGEVPGLVTHVRDDAWLREHGFGGVLAVGGGSARPPRLVELHWRPRGSAKGPHLVLVGKGITFDTGGISIKPALNMHLMRTDMAGGAAVIAAVVAIARLRLPVRVTGVVPMAENHVSGSAYRPGDVVRHHDGRTTHVDDSDAEGRMVLGDALGYAVRSLRPDVLVDVATLTGAVLVSLGRRTGGLFSTDDALAADVVAAGERAGEAWWRLPLGFDVVDLHTATSERITTGSIADLAQAPRGPGSIVGATFLREFTRAVPRWAHLDIAGAAREEKAYDEVPDGATGFAARTLVELAAGLAP